LSSYKRSEFAGGFLVTESNEGRTQEVTALLCRIDQIDLLRKKEVSANRENALVIRVEMVEV